MRLSIKARLGCKSLPVAIEPASSAQGQQEQRVGGGRRLIVNAGVRFLETLF